jgi:hypothetical protein
MVCSSPICRAHGTYGVLDPPGQLLEQPGELVDQTQVLAAQERMMIAEAPFERVEQLGYPGTQAPLGPACKHDRITFPRDQRFQDRPAGRAEQVGQNAGDLDLGVLQRLLQALGLPGPLAQQRGAVPGQIAQLPDRLRRHERCFHQTAFGQLAQPDRIQNIRLTPGQALDMRGIDQDRLHSLFQYVEHPAPILARRLQHDRGDVLPGQPVTQLQQVPRRGTVSTHLLPTLTAFTVRWESDADDQLLLPDVDRRDPPVQHVHTDPSSPGP